MSETDPSRRDAAASGPSPGPSAKPRATGNAAAGAKAATGAYTPAAVSPNRRGQRRYTIRLWAVRHSRLLEWVYHRFAHAFLLLHPLWKAIGYARAEAPVTAVERRVKGVLFDCRMCGQCILSSTGMSCPMNCPKQLRNGPCGGVRANGNCEVEPDMPCVWVKAWEGSRQMAGGDAILAVQKPVNQSLRETSSWLRVTAAAAMARDDEKDAGGTR
ncbi:methylenetetrahydrofolate reductase [Rhizobium rhizosphaerae]|uniref:Methylenetetrahydrofolate reductase n=1 Tax=Xaviernesmea rhizosphaerae TaxID=1672749 RepID=A0ABX3PIQ2_9HYPH|nr:methylenetetrahydrofolate reductase C-terminal domain-containing protein [Xaviernesmea rhizosphaerae]OQP88400.1 methylenetetrahydrofolate reductase [Xaviernesmea rhizosphaerae]